MDKIEIGDIIVITDWAGHDSTHRWFKNNLSRDKTIQYEVIDIDYNKDVAKIGNTAFRLSFTKLIKKGLYSQLEQARKIIYTD